MKKLFLIPIIVIMINSSIFAKDFKASLAHKAASAHAKALEKKMGTEIFEKLAYIAFETIKRSSAIVPYNGIQLEIHYGNSKALLKEIDDLGGPAAKFIAWNKLQERLVENGYKLSGCVTGRTFKCSVYWKY